ncbi:phosphatase PAP2 family protein [Natronolimnohabitans sp. A-GB9]|uniref:phosphatase PAP2 family protein n=1 Tax=Natronolimnohabitans sp. A-GB9 TaxID=3069757 RepID=UPI0027AF8796|nr:phosphatase PAP2 family protein [Natronolimnohabitans sp. A-GB9]MDQ2052775.1 phosphatase PAP2 family protein [Natronolimnohabitans sp. A-GB9]
MLADVLLRLTIVVGLMLPVALVLFVGRERLWQLQHDWRDRVRTCAPALALLAVTLVFNRWMRDTNPDTRFSTYMTDTIRRIEGEFVLVFQEIETWWLTEYFSWIYVYGYAFLLIFPGVAYFLLSDTRTFRRLVTAYALNYVLGVVLYVLVIAYGPRNVFLTEVEVATMLYDHSPEYQYLTREVNRNTNVFPSLHTSLAATVGIFAYHTRATYRAWFPVAVVLAASVAISTMYLAIHWAIDVVAGLILAYACVALSDRLVGRWTLTELRDELRERLRTDRW